MNPIVIIMLVVLAVGGYWFISQEDQADQRVDSVVSVRINETQHQEGDMMDKEADKMMEKEKSTEDAMMKEDEKMIEKEEGEDAMMMEEKETDVMMEKEEVMKKDPSTSSGQENQAPAPEPVSTAPGTYADYSAARVAQAEGDVVLFFAAAWCPSCRTLDGDISGNTSEIPSGVTILKVDYDSETALKQQYGVTTQHTLVQVDSLGNQIQTWRGGNDLASIISRL